MIAVAANRLNQRPKTRPYSPPKEKSLNELMAEEKEKERILRQKENETKFYDLCQEKAGLNPPEYLIQVSFNNKSYNTFLYNNKKPEAPNQFDEPIFASSFDDAVKKVQSDIESPDSDIMKGFKQSQYYRDGDVLRLSSANKSFLRGMDYSKPDGSYFFKSINKSVLFWGIIISSDKPTTLSSWRISNQNKNNMGGKSRKKHKSKKSKKSKKRTKPAKTKKRNKKHRKNN